MARAHPPKRRLPAAQRRLVIEDAASEIFAERGYAEARLDDIASAAGVTKQLLYRHFSSKKELHMALLAKHRDGLLHRLSEAMAQPGDLSERLPMVLDHWFGYVEDHPFAAVMLFRDTTGDPEIQSVYRRNQAAARALNAQLIRAEGLDVSADRIEPLAELIRSATTGLALWWAENPQVPRSVVVGVTVDTLSRGLDI